MRKTLKDFYFGNLTPSDRDVAAGSELKRAVDRVARCEQQLTERLDEAGQAILNELVSSGRHHSGGKFYPGFPAGRSDHGRVYGWKR